MGVVTERVEDYAHREGLLQVTLEFLDRIRQERPVDFSKRLPFVAQGED